LTAAGVYRRPRCRPGDDLSHPHHGLDLKVAHREDGSRFESALVVLIGVSVVWGSIAGFAIFLNRPANADLK
jgi:hypothetical protein